jgi:hypothetical protein
MVFLFGASVQVLLGSSILALIAELVILLWKVKRELKISADTDALGSFSQILQTTAPLAGAAVSNTAQLQAYRVLMAPAGHAEGAAALAVTSNIGAVGMSSCAQVYSQLFLPRLYQSKGAFINQYVFRAILLAAIVLIVGLYFSEFLVAQLASTYYKTYAPMVGVGIIVEACNLVVGAYSVYLTLFHRVAILFYFQFATATMSIIGCFWALTYANGAVSVIAAAIVMSQLVLVFSLGVYVYKFNKNVIYDDD